MLMREITGKFSTVTGLCQHTKFSKFQYLSETLPFPIQNHSFLSVCFPLSAEGWLVPKEGPLAC